ncbi:MAG: ABC transporter ATP-binding protein [Candidatus Omnitrophica bacterium]|nr:ABC transporter ATP-binding protein [Candidatus Omnitrophota bacterium]
MNPDLNNILLEAKSLQKTFKTGEEDLVVLHDLHLQIHKNEFLAVTGESGSGKSTLLHLLGCLDHPTSGQILYLGRDLAQTNGEELNRIRNCEFGFVFQFHHLLPEFNALENVMLPGMIAGLPARDLREKARSLLTDLGLGHRLSHKPSRLSGGEQQRTAVARSMINSPAILFMDEPTGNLDPASSDELIALIRKQQQNRHLTIVIVTHNQSIARNADRHLQLQDGNLKPGVVE